MNTTNTQSQQERDKMLREVRALNKFYEFKKFLISLEQQLNAMMLESENQDFRFEDFTYKCTLHNKEIHELILTYLSSHITTNDNLNDVREVCKVHRASKRETNYGVMMVMDCYLRYFAERYFNMAFDDSGKVVNTGDDNFDYNNKSDFERKLRKAREDSLSLLILPSGEAYFAFDIHKRLAQWLTVNGVDFKGAVRVSIGKTARNMKVTSLQGFYYSNTSENDSDIQLTSEQAEAIAKIYSYFKYSWVNFSPFEEIAEQSDLFALGQSPNKMKNLKRMEWELGEKEFSRAKYLRSLGEMPDFFEGSI